MGKEMDIFLNFFISNLVAIIQWLIAIILLFIGAWCVVAILGRGRSQSRGVSLESADLSSLESTLREIAQKGVATGGERAPTKAGEVSIEAGKEAVALDSADSVSMEKMAEELSEKEVEIQTLKKAAQAKAASEEEVSSYLEKIKELEGKLAEYEIIEDEIADLSMYKKENALLKQRLEEVEGTAFEQSGPASEPAPTSTKDGALEDNEPLTSTVEKGEDLVAEFVATVEKTETASTAEESIIEEPANSALDEAFEPPNHDEKKAPPSTGEDLLNEFADTLTDEPASEFNTQDQSELEPETALGNDDEESALEDMDKVVAEADNLASGE